MFWARKGQPVLQPLGKRAEGAQPMKRLVSTSGFAASMTAAMLFAATGPVLAAEEHAPQHVERLDWSFAGIGGQYDRAQLQRGFQVFQQVCTACHGLKYVRFRNLAEPGGPQFPVEAVKALAASWPYQITDGPNDEGKMIERLPTLADAHRWSLQERQGSTRGAGWGVAA